MDHALDPVDRGVSRRAGLQYTPKSSRVVVITKGRRRGVIASFREGLQVGALRTLSKRPEIILGPIRRLAGLTKI